MTQPSTELDAPPGTGPVRVLAGVAALLAVVFCVLGFVGGVGVGDLAGVLVVGGGLLAGTVALPKPGRVLAPSSVAVAVGVLMLLQAVMTSRVTMVLIIALVVAFAEMVAAVGALLIDVGLVARVPERSPAPVESFDAPGASAWGPPPDDYPSGPADPPYEHAGAPGGAAVFPPEATATLRGPATDVPSADVFPVGPSGAAPLYGLSAPSSPAPERATEAVARFGHPPVDGSAPGPGTANGSGHFTTSRYDRSPAFGGPNGSVPAGPESRGRVDGSAPAHLFDGQAPATTHPGPNGSPRGFGQPTPGPAASPEPDSSGGLNGSGPTHGATSPGAPGAVNGSGQAYGWSPSTPAPSVNGAPARLPGSPDPGLASFGSGAPASARPATGESPSPRSRSGAGTANGASTHHDPADSDAPGNTTMPVQSPAVAELPPPISSGTRPTPSGPSGAHRAGGVVPGQPAPGGPSPARGVSRSGAHRAPTAEASLLGLPEPDVAAGAGPASGPSSPSRAGAGESPLPRRRPSPSGSPSGQHTAPNFGVTEDSGSSGGPYPPGGFDGAGRADVERGRQISALGLFQPAPHGSSSHPGLPPAGPVAERRPGPPDATPATTAFRAQPGRREPDATPVWGQAAFDGAAEPSTPTPSWLSPGPDELVSPRERRYDADDERRATRDDADPDVTRFFPTGER